MGCQGRLGPPDRPYVVGLAPLADDLIQWVDREKHSRVEEAAGLILSGNTLHVKYIKTVVTDVVLCNNF